METVEYFVREWGYWAVFLGACVEGESVMLLACYFAYHGQLSWSGVGSVAFIGTVFADQGLFLLGKYHGQDLLKRWPVLKLKADKVFHLLHKYDTWFILSCRFIYGIRVASPIILGASPIPLKRFALLNILSAVIWTGASLALGYVCAKSVHALLDYFSQIKSYVIGGIALALIGGWGSYRLWKIWISRNPSEPPSQ